MKVKIRNRRNSKMAKSIPLEHNVQELANLVQTFMPKIMEQDVQVKLLIGLFQQLLNKYEKK